jgi:hypothetical protein
MEDSQIKEATTITKVEEEEVVAVVVDLVGVLVVALRILTLLAVTSINNNNQYNKPATVTVTIKRLHGLFRKRKTVKRVRRHTQYLKKNVLSLQKY